jgi:hypothetical protein
VVAMLSFYGLQNYDYNESLIFFKDYTTKVLDPVLSDVSGVSICDGRTTDIIDTEQRKAERLSGP